MDQNTVHSKVKEIKQSFRLMMDGAVAQSMRDKGLNYHLNWGATIPRLQAKAEEIKESLTHSLDLWSLCTFRSKNHEPLTDLSVLSLKEVIDHLFPYS